MSYIHFPHLIATPQLPQQHPQYPPTPASSISIDFGNQLFDSAVYEQALAILQQSAIQPLMSDQQYLQNPPIRVQQSTPTPQPTGFEYRQDSVVGGDVQGLPHDWQAFADGMTMGGITHATSRPGYMQRRRSHQRTPSASTVGSNGPASPFAQTTSYPMIANPDRSPTSPSHLESAQPAYADESSGHFSKALPTPTQTPTEMSFLGADSQMGYMPSQAAHTPAAHLAMKDFAIDHHNSTDDAPDFTHSSRQSVSSYGRDSPSTPHTVFGEEMDDRTFKVPSNGETPTDSDDEMMDDCLLFDLADYTKSGPNIQLQRTESAACQDELYNPANFTSAPSSATRATPQRNFLSPHRNLVSERLQTANIARSTSPTSAARHQSPFRQGSPLAPPSGYDSPRGAIGTAAGARQQQKEQIDQEAYAQHQPTLQREPTKTISPKDALLDYHGTDETPLFQDNYPDGYKQHFGASQTYSSNYMNQPQQAWAQMPMTSGQQHMSFRATSADDGFSGASNFVSQTPPNSSGQGQIPSNNPYSTDLYRAANTTNTYPTAFNMSEHTPEFPAHLTSMDSSISEGPPPSSQDTITSMPQRPNDTRAGTGTYTCTYHGCTQRFDLHANLQRHKRDFHRSQAQKDNSSASASASVSAAASAGTASTSPRSTESPAPTSASSSGLTSSAILARNSQAGPHKCTRINPSTNKPCNTIFSRPYDLTRHEDTIHNNRKQKVRCPYCREEKTFSRNDALTRHLRVVHPEVETYGKRSRKGD